MAKATLKLGNGTLVTIEGSLEEVRELLSHYEGEPSISGGGTTGSAQRTGGSRQAAKASPGATVDLAAIVNLVKDCDEAEAIETNILDRASQVDRTLLPLYIVHEYLDNAFDLTSGQIAKITADLGIPISQPAASRALSGTASKYVMGDGVKRKGKPVHYKLSRRGVKYVHDVIRGDHSG